MVFSIPKSVKESLYPPEKAFHDDKHILCFLLRKISLWVSFRILSPLNIHPNFLTFLSLLSGILASALFMGGCYVGGGILLISWCFFDCLDGEVARLSGKNSKLGGMLESLNSDIQYLLWLPSLAFGLSQDGLLGLSWVFAMVLACGLYNIARKFHGTYPKEFLGEPRGNLKVFIASQFKDMHSLRTQNGFASLVFYSWRNLITQMGLQEMIVLGVAFFKPELLVDLVEAFAVVYGAVSGLTLTGVFLASLWIAIRKT